MTGVTTEVDFTSALPIRSDRIYLAAAPVSIPARAAFTRIYHYDACAPQPWTKHDMPWWTVALAKHRERHDAAWRLCALSEDGDVELVSHGKSIVERIPDAGLRGSESKGYGYVSSLRSIGNHLYVCGGGGQVYKRISSGDWEHMDDGLLQPRASANRLLLQTINGPNHDDLYVAGDLIDSSGLEGCLFHWNGVSWQRIDLPRVGGLNAIYVENEERIWVVGLKGALLVGNHRAGFTNLMQTKSPHLLHDLIRYNDTLYLGSNYGLFRYDEARLRINRVNTGLVPEPRYVHTVGQADGVLWAVGPKDIAQFDGNIWTRLQHPDNPAT